MPRLAWILCLEILTITACGKDAGETASSAAIPSAADARVEYAGEAETVSSAPEPTPANPKDAEPRLPDWRNWGPLCQGFPSKQDCDDGDATLFSGLLCLAGEDIGCRAVQAAQDTEGKFWRSPRRVGLDTRNSFSRDMALGVLAWLVATRDTAAAQAWLQWIDQNSVCQINFGGSCQLRTFRYCRDDSDGRCFITPGMWSLMRRVWENLGLPLHAAMSSSGESTLISEAQQAPIGYALHLKAVTLFLYQKMAQGRSFEKDLQKTVIERQPDNLFFRYLNAEPEDLLQASLLATCPTTEPAEKRQWSWERDTAEHAELQSMGWDCVFMARLLKLIP